MIKNILLICLCTVSGFAHSQTLLSTDSTKSNKIESFEGVLILSPSQQTELKASRKSFIEQMKLVINGTDIPPIKSQKIRKLRVTQDSTVKLIVGIENYEEFINQTRITKEKVDVLKRDKNNKINGLKTKLNLDNQQTAAIENLLNNYQFEKQKIGLQYGLNLEESKAKIQALKREMKNKIVLLLTVKQQETYKTMNVNL